MFLLAMTLSFTAVFAPVNSQTSNAYVLSVEHVHTGAGDVLSPGQVLVRDGKIVEVAAQVKGDALPVVSLKGHLSAGMIALGDTSVLGDQASDTTRFLMPEGESRFGFDPRNPALNRLAREGITTVVMTPPSTSLLAGRGLIAKTGNGRVLAQGQALHVAFDSQMFRNTPDPAPDDAAGGGFFFFFGPNGAVTPNGYKSSYPGAAELLEESIQDGKTVTSKLVNGGIHAWLRSRNRAEATRALSFAARHKVKGTLEGGARIGDLATEIKSSGLGVAMRSFSATNQHFATQSALSLAKAGVPFGFCLDAKGRHAASLRMSAALCRRAGLSAKESWSALTSGAAKAVGLDGIMGSIAAGKQADLVLWDGDPGELTSRVLKVWVEGAAVAGIDSKQGANQ